MAFISFRSNTFMYPLNPQTRTETSTPEATSKALLSMPYNAKKYAGIYTSTSSHVNSPKQKSHSPKTDSTVYLHLKETGHSYEDSCPVLTREDRWWRGVSKKLSLSSWKKLRHYLSNICNAVIYCLLLQSKLSHLHTGSRDLSHCDPAD